MLFYIRNIKHDIGKGTEDILQIYLHEHNIPEKNYGLHYITLLSYRNVRKELKSLYGASFSPRIQKKIVKSMKKCCSSIIGSTLICKLEDPRSNHGKVNSTTGTRTIGLSEDEWKRIKK